jgi:uncharacterized protein (TIGR03000 family)
MRIRPSLGVAACAVLFFSNSAFAQYFPHGNYAIGSAGSATIVRPPAFALGYGAFNPNFGTPAFVPGVGYGYYPNYTALRRSYWALPGRYNAYPWSGAGVYTGGTAVNAYYWPYFSYGSGMDVGLASPYASAANYGGPYSDYGAGYGFGYDSGNLYSAPMMVNVVRPSAPAMESTPSTPLDRAVLNVQVPADASVWIEGTATKQSGATRTFVSPPLESGKDYAYTVKAQWKVGDKSVEDTRTVNVRAGDRKGVVFLPEIAARAPGGR